MGRPGYQTEVKRKNLNRHTSVVLRTTPHLVHRHIQQLSVLSLAGGQEPPTNRCVERRMVSARLGTEVSEKYEKNIEIANLDR